VLLKVIPCHLAQLVLLGRCNRLLGRAKSLTAAGFYLHKDQNVPMLGDDVNLTEGTAIITADDAVPQAFQVKEGELLTLIPLKQVGFGPTSSLLAVLMHDGI
jgi:hypothetical protein